MTQAKRNTTDTNGIAQEFTFGVEIETTCPKRNKLRIGSYHSTGEQGPYLPEGLVAKSDCSIRTEKPGHVGGRNRQPNTQRRSRNHPTHRSHPHGIGIPRRKVNLVSVPSSFG
jgi:hypothetical protein